MVGLHTVPTSTIRDPNGRVRSTFISCGHGPARHWLSDLNFSAAVFEDDGDA